MSVLLVHKLRALTGFLKFSKVVEINYAIFQDLGSFEKERFLKMALGKFWIFV